MTVMNTRILVVLGVLVFALAMFKYGHSCNQEPVSTLHETTMEQELEYAERSAREHPCDGRKYEDSEIGVGVSPNGNIVVGEDYGGDTTGVDGDSDLRGGGIF